MATINVCDACGKHLNWRGVHGITFEKHSYHLMIRHCTIEDFEFCYDCYTRLMNVMLEEKELIKEENE